MTHKTAELTLRERAREISQRDKIPLEAALKAASAVDPGLAAEVHAERHGRPIIKKTEPTIPEQTRMELAIIDRVRDRQREMRCDFARAYAAVCDEDADYYASDAAAAAVFLSLANTRAREAQIEFSEAVNRQRIETPNLWRRAVAARRVT